VGGDDSEGPARVRAAFDGTLDDDRSFDERAIVSARASRISSSRRTIAASSPGRMVCGLT
jgi:hypothetical protein